MTQALIVVDVQNDFCPGGALAVDDGAAVVAPINAMLDQYQVRIFTQDWHPAEHTSFASQHPGKAPFSTTEMPYGQQVLWPDHCVQGTHGADFAPGLCADAADVILRKGFRASVDSYSAFFENDRRTATGLQGYLESRNVSVVFLVGLATDFCVRHSAEDAVRAGFETTVMLPACRGIDKDGSLKEALAAMRHAGVTLAD